MPTNGCHIPAPKLFPILWKLAQPILSEESKKKIKVLGKNYKDELLKYVEEDQLPAYLGGTMTGPNGDPMCSHQVSVPTPLISHLHNELYSTWRIFITLVVLSQICHGGEVPESYYLDDITTTKSMDKATVSPGNELKIECEVTTPGSILRYNLLPDLMVG